MKNRVHIWTDIDFVGMGLQILSSLKSKISVTETFKTNNDAVVFSLVRGV